MKEMIVSAFFFAVMAAGAKHLAETLPMQQVVLFRGVINGCLTYAWLRAAGIPWWGTDWRVLALRGALGHVSLSCYFWSVSLAPLAQAVLIQQVHPVFVALLAWMVLRERPGRAFIPAFLLALVGVVLLILPSGADLALGWPALIGLTGAIASAGAYVTVRHATRTDHPLTIVFWFPVISAVLSIPGVVVEGPVLPRGWDWFSLLFVSLTAQFGQVFLTLGLSKQPAGRATLANPLTSGFGVLFGWLWFAETLSLLQALGGLLLVLAVLLASWRKELTAARPLAGGRE